MSSLLDPRELVQALSFSCIISVIMISRDVSPEDSGVNDVWSVGSSDDEDILLAAHAIHLSQDLPYNNVGKFSVIMDIIMYLVDNSV